MYRFILAKMTNIIVVEVKTMIEKKIKRLMKYEKNKFI